MQTKRSLIAFSSTIVSLLLFGCLGEERVGSLALNCDSDPVTPLPINFTSTGYWENNPPLQEAFPNKDSIELARHYCKYGADQGLSFGSDPIYSSSNELSSNTKTSSNRNSSAIPSSSIDDQSSSFDKSSSSTPLSSSKGKSSAISGSSSSKKSSSSTAQSSSKGKSSAISGSSAAHGSSSSPTSSSSVDAGCQRTLVTCTPEPGVEGDCESNFEGAYQLYPHVYLQFNTEQNGTIAGWTKNGTTRFNVGDWIVPEGADCDMRVQITALSDTHNLAVSPSWSGEFINVSKVEIVTPLNGTEW